MGESGQLVINTGFLQEIHSITNRIPKMLNLQYAKNFPGPEAAWNK